MKKINIIIYTILSIIIGSCSGSETYRGSWKATNNEGSHFDITFDAKRFIIKDSTNIKDTFKYMQNAISIENGVSTYGIQISDGRNYKITFPLSNNNSVGFMTDDDGNSIYTISRKNYLSHEDIYKLK
jgi:hypothetical protein